MLWLLGARSWPVSLLLGALVLAAARGPASVDAGSSLPQARLEVGGRSQIGYLVDWRWPGRSGGCSAETAGAQAVFPSPVPADAGEPVRVLIDGPGRPVAVTVRAWTALGPSGRPVGDPARPSHQLRPGRSGWVLRLAPRAIGDLYLRVDAAWAAGDCDGVRRVTWAFHLRS